MSHEAGPITWHKLATDADKTCDKFDCEAPAVYELRHDGWWPSFSCYEHTHPDNREAAEANADAEWERHNRYEAWRKYPEHRDAMIAFMAPPEETP